LKSEGFNAMDCGFGGFDSPNKFSIYFELNTTYQYKVDKAEEIKSKYELKSYDIWDPFQNFRESDPDEPIQVDFYL
jgi:hypothetical protein